MLFIHTCLTYVLQTSLSKMSPSQPSSSSELADNIKKVKDKIAQVYDMLPNFCLAEETPDLQNSLREAMKCYVITESKYQDLKTSKQKVAQHFMEQIANNKEKDLSLDEINELLKNTIEKENEKHQVGFWEADKLYASMKDFTEEINEEDDLAVTGETIQIIDPYSKIQFSDPVKNVRCKHSYEKAIIYELIASNPQTKCYWMGCSNRIPIKPRDLVPDDDLRRHMARLKARAAI